MAAVEIPTPLRALLTGSPVEAPTLQLAEAVGTILLDNETPFFPSYTDHGTQHVERVLQAAVHLTPPSVWEEGLLTRIDGCVLICSVLLHDLAMHLREEGFLELVAPDSRYTPRLWFSDPQEGRPADQPWPDLWAAFQKEARHFGTSEIELLLGEHGSSIPAVAYADRLEPALWTTADRILIGEFLRRHHARLAHEIASFGFPGTNAEEFPVQFPVLAETLPDLAEAIGVVARSHNEPLRRMCAYLEFLEQGNKRPAGALLHFHMSLLRIADYIQIEADRAPPLLMLLKAVQSPRSIEEWDKHGAVSSFAWEHEDPLAIYVTVSPQHGLRTHLALGDLLRDLQREMDTTVAVLSEVYGSHDGLAELSLSRQRVLSNIDMKSLHVQLPYLPRRAALRSDKDLFRLVVKDLYGNQPAVAGRELIQNAVDAVRARVAWERASGRTVAEGDSPPLKADVEATVIVTEKGACSLLVADKGIGMTPGTVIDYFLTAGASFGPTPMELEGMEIDELVQTMKAGRFGVGAFAGFLLGDEIQVTTRHVTALKGVRFTARIDEDLVRLDWCDAPVGTSIRIPVNPAALLQRSWDGEEESLAPKELLGKIAEFYRLADPKVDFRLVRESELETLSAPADVPSPNRRLPNRWRSVQVPGIDAVLWRIPKRSRLQMDDLHSMEGGLIIHNGVLIRDPGQMIIIERGAYQWSDAALRGILRRPNLAVYDSRHTLGIALHRYNLIDTRLFFEHHLLSSIGKDLVAQAVVEGPRNHPLSDADHYVPVHSRTEWFPLLPALLPLYGGGSLLVMWKPEDHEWGLQLPFPDLGAFLSPRSPVGWRNFPRRTAITTEMISTDNYDLSEVHGWGVPLDLVAKEVSIWQKRLGASAHTTVVFRDLPAPDQEAYVTDDYSIPWRHIGNQYESSGIFIAGKRASQPTLEEKLIDAARALHEHDASSSVALTVYSGLSGSGSLQEQLTDPWVRHIKGALPRSRSSRDAIEEEFASKRAWRPLINKWRRLSEELSESER